MQSKRRRSKDLFKQFIKPFKEIDVEGIVEKTKVDEFSKKLNLREHLSIMLWHVVGDCIMYVIIRSDEGLRRHLGYGIR